MDRKECWDRLLVVGYYWESLKEWEWCVQSLSRGTFVTRSLPNIAASLACRKVRVISIPRGNRLLIVYPIIDFSQRLISQSLHYYRRYVTICYTCEIIIDIDDCFDGYNSRHSSNRRLYSPSCDLRFSAPRICRQCCENSSSPFNVRTSGA